MIICARRSFYKWAKKKGKITTTTISRQSTKQMSWLKSLELIGYIEHLVQLVIHIIRMKSVFGLTFALPRHKQIVEVVDHFAGIKIRVLNDRPWHAQSRIWEQRRQPIAVHIHTVFDGFVLGQRKRQSMTDDVHAPIDLKFHARGSIQFISTCFDIVYIYTRRFGM